MKKSVYKIMVMAALMLMSTSSVHSQQLRASLSHYSASDGLTSNAIASIAQDDYGYLWIATWNGLSRFDGYEFYNYKTGNGSHIKNLHNRIFEVTIDASQNVWMRMYDGRVFVLNRHTDKIENPFEGYTGYEEFRTNYPLIATSAGDVLTTIAGSGLYIQHLDRHGLKTDQVTTGGLVISSMAEGYQSDIWLGTNKGIHRLDRSNLSIEQKGILDEENVTALHSNGFNIFAATAQGAIYSFAYGQEPTLIRKPTGQYIFRVFVDSHGLIWFCDDRMGASCLDPKTGVEQLFQQDVRVPEHDSRGGAFRENNGTVWVRMNHGGYGYYNREANRLEYFHNDPTNLWDLSNTVNAVLELPEGVVWMSTSRRGLEKLEILKNNIVRKFPVADAKSSEENEIRAMLYDEKRKLLLLGNKDSKLFIYDRDSNRTVITSDDQGRPIGRLYGISKDSKGNYWICSKDNGVYKMTQHQGGWSLHNFRHEEGNSYSLSSNAAYLSVEDKQGNIWVATYGGGINLLPKENIERGRWLHLGNEMKKYPKSAFKKMRCVALDAEGNVWGGSTDGILILSYKNKKVSIKELEYPDDESLMLQSNDVVCLACDTKGNMVVGTNGGGLSRTKGQDAEGRWMFETFDSRNGLPSEEIRSITFDQRGNIWFGTDQIINSFDVDKKIFTSFSSLDGVDNVMLSEGAAITTGNGDILFGTLNGYYLVDRKKLMATKGSLLRMRITDFFLNGEIQSPRLNSNYKEYPIESKVIKIPRSRDEFAFRFAALNYQLQHRVHYQYMLDGYDEDWQNADDDRMARYKGVPGGTYTFRAKAFLLESPDKYDMRTIQVIVPGSSLLSPLALLLYVLLALILLAIVFKIPIGKFIKRIRERNKKAEPEVEETDNYEIIDASEL